ncbi:hypothetical protein B0J14DRAFT_686360 [Halenospora varia]|nr:hypothetical protein B0J14DRAFT_686360 [Halenospora varia]
MRRETTDALDDILIVAQDDEHRTSQFDLYVSSYVHFFDDTTDECDKWSFAHDRVSNGRPKLVKGLRKEINDKADVIKSYEIPAPKLPEHRVRNVQPDSTFDGHRFCEKNRTFEDQFYHPDLWLWNLQYYDEQSGEHAGVVMTDANNVKYMSAPQGIDEAQNFTTVLGVDGNPDAAIPPGDDPHTLQYGFGWTARPFHPKWEGHKALKDFFVQRMKDDNIPQLNTIEPSPPPAPSRNGPIERKYNEGTPEEIIFRLQGPGDFKPSSDDCKMYLLSILTDGCDANDPKNPENYKGGGKETIDNVIYEMQPNDLRQPAEKGKQGGCSSSYKALFNDNWVWGHGWDDADHGDALKDQLKGCALLPDTWHFDYGLGDDGREWTAKFRTGVFQRKCVGHAAISAGAPPSLSCSGSG